MDGDVKYIAGFKRGVEAHDQKKDESWVVYHPDDMYDWPQVLRKRGPLLFIGTRGEGLVVVNVVKPHIHRFPKVGLGSRSNVAKLEFAGSDLVVNGKEHIPLSKFTQKK